MPRSAKTPCRQSGCRELVDKPGYCVSHKKQKAKVHDKHRGSSAKRGYSYKWQQARIGFLKKHWSCVEHAKQNRIVEATVVDHIKPHQGDKTLFWDRSNWQALCKSCHDRKTAIEDSNFAGGRGG